MRRQPWWLTAGAGRNRFAEFFRCLLRKVRFVLPPDTVQSQELAVFVCPSCLSRFKSDCCVFRLELRSLAMHKRIVTEGSLRINWYEVLSSFAVLMVYRISICLTCLSN